MRNLFKLKGKLHRLINILFYLIFFVIGFLIGKGGGSIEKISNLFNDII